MLTEQFDYRELLVQMTKRDLLLRYKQTIMGFAWAVFMPLVNTAVFSVIFTRVATLETPVAYPLFAYCGLWVWNHFASSLRFAVTSLTSNASLVSKVYFPREIFPVSAVLVCTVDFLVGSSVMVALMIWYRTPVELTWLWLPLVLAVQLAFTCAIALMIAMANLFYRDVKYLFEIVITVWMFATSVLYPVSGVSGIFGAVMRANPMTIVVDAYRTVLFYGQPPSPAFGVLAVATLLLLAATWLVFHRREFEFAERV
jgi:ABC-2 type transport system permease protein/lipopolysaccharide transport system permease protein